MSSYRDFEGKDLDEVIRAASDAFRVQSETLVYQLLDEGRRGVFGLGARSVRIRVRLEDVEPARDTSPAPAAPPRSPRPAPVARSSPHEVSPPHRPHDDRRPRPERTGRPPAPPRDNRPNRPRPPVRDRQAAASVPKEVQAGRPPRPGAGAPIDPKSQETILPAAETMIRLMGMEMSVEL